MFDTTVDTAKEISELMTQIKSINNNSTYTMIYNFIKLFEESASVFSITTGFGICGGVAGRPRFARITLRIRHLATNRYYIVEHDRYLDGVNKSKTSWVSNEKWLAESLNKTEIHLPPMRFSQTKWIDVVRFVQYVNGSL